LTTLLTPAMLERENIAADKEMARRTQEVPLGKFQMERLILFRILNWMNKMANT
jgi:hypothetical protein